MRDDFAVFILTHGRPDNIKTLKALKKGNYTGKLYIVIDDEDKTGDDYKTMYGNQVIVFNKQKFVDMTDTADNFNEHRAIVYARNASFHIAKELGLKYFLMLDDDYVHFQFRFADGRKFAHAACKDLDRLFEGFVEFLEESGALTIAMAQGGDFIGGLENGRFEKGLLRKAMNTFFCSTERPFQFVGTQNEDVSAYTSLGSRGELLFTVTDAMIDQVGTQQGAGGMSAVYKEGGTYIKSFYSVMVMPSAVKVKEMTSAHARIHHSVNWRYCVPEILNERWKK